MDVFTNNSVPLEVILEENATLNVELSSSSSIGISVEIQTPHAVDVETYEGEYEITPSVSRQELETKNRLLSDDIVVKEIPYYETSNESGITIYIG